MRLLYINPNSTEAMTESVASVARAAVPDHEVLAATNHAGPPAIQGAADGAAAVPGLLALLPFAKAQAVDAIIIACFDDTGLAEMRAAAHCPVLGIGQAAYVAASLLGQRFSVVTTLAVSVPVLAENIATQGFGPRCREVRPTGLPVLTVESGTPEVIARISEEIAQAQAEDGIDVVVLGCAGMARLQPALQAQHAIPVLDGVAASAHLAVAVASLR